MEAPAVVAVLATAAIYGAVVVTEVVGVVAVGGAVFVITCVLEILTVVKALTAKITRLLSLCPLQLALTCKSKKQPDRTL